MNKMIQTLTISAVSALTTMFAVADGDVADGFAFKNGDTIAFLGDSITQAGSYDDGYIRLFEKVILNLGIEQYTFFERGVGGNTSADMLARVDKDVVAYHPTWTTYSAGVNDICYSGKTQTLDQYKANVTATFDKLDACGTKVIVFTTTPISEQTGESALDPYVTWLREEANRRGYRIAEMNTAMKDELIARGATGSTPWKLTIDGIHLNADGNKIMAWELLKAFGIDALHKDEIYGIFASGDPVATPYPKAVWRDGTKTLTFYYNTHSYANDADVTAEYAIGADGSKTWNDVLPDVEHAAFDLSFVYFMPTDCTAWFWKASKLKDIDRLDYLNTVNCQSTGQMFGDCGSLTNLNLSFFNTAKVVTMYQMFRNLSSITELDLSTFDTSNVQSFWQMFGGDSSLKRIIVSDKFVTTKVTDGTEMFSGCTSLVGGNGTTFDPAKVTSAMAHVDVAGNPGYLTLVGTTPVDPQEDDPVVPGQLDYWKYDDGEKSMTDGEWTFKAQMRYDMIDGSIYPIWVEGCTGYPATPTTLDFSKDVVYEADRSLKFAITKIQPGFNGSTAGQSVKILKLPTHGYPFNIGDGSTVIEGFKNCHNLESVVPFLPDSCIAIGAGTFSGCEKLASPLIWRGGSAMLKPSDPTWESSYASLWGLFEGTAIPSVDLSESDIVAVMKNAFGNCKSLKSVKLPQALTLLDGQPFANCEALELVEFNSVTKSLSGFEGCSALKEVRFNHAAPSGPNAIDALIYNAISTEYQYIATYLVLDSDESDKLEIWKNYATGNVINSSDSTWAAAYAGDANLSKRRPLLLYAAKSVSLAAGENGSYTADQPGTFIISRGDGDSLGGMVMVNYTISGGTAQSGVHFEPLSGTASIPSGSKTGVIEVTPKYFGSVGTETLTLKLAEGDYEIISGSDEATISLSTEALRSVSIAKGEDAEATSGQVGTFVISRGVGDALGGSITVNYTIDAGSTAQPDVHYLPLSGVATIPAGEREGVIEVTPKYFGYVGTETLTLKLAAGDYEIGADEASISLSTKFLRSVSIAKGEDADEGAGNVGYFIISRGEGDQTAVPLEVSLSVGGTAVAGQTYRPIGTVATIPAGEKSTKVKVVPYDDPSVTEDKTVEATILPGAYGIGTASADPVVIKNGATYGGWKFVGEKGTSITDGTWTFEVSRRTVETFADGVHELRVQACTAWPTEVSTLDFGKAFHNFYDDTYYMIGRLEFEFGGNAAASVVKPAGAVLGALVLPDDDGYKFSISGSCFANCPNLTSITPFLPRSCDKLGRDTFSFLPALAETDLYFYGSDFGSDEGCWGIVQNDTSITNADLSASTITVLRRDCFKNCTGLAVVKLPPTIQEFGAPHNSDGMYNRSPFVDVGGVKLIFTGGALPLMNCNDGNVSAIEFKMPVSTLPDNAFYSYFNPYGETLLTSITFVGEPPATIGENVFSGANGGFAKDTVTVNVPAYYIKEWRAIADDGKLSRKYGGTWTSGTTQLINVYGEVKAGFMLIVR